MPAGSVDVVIPSFNAYELVAACVERLLEDPAVARVIVVDDASSDGSPERLAARFPALSVVRLDAHRGLAYAMNRGAERAAAEFVLFLNDDVLAGERAVSGLADALDEDPKSVSAGGRLVDPGSTRTQVSYAPRQLPDLGGLLVRLTGIERYWPRNPWTGKHVTAPLNENRRQRTDRQPAGACLLVRRAILERIGGWDERYWMWYEDVDISRRLLKLGPAVYVPDAVFEHVGRASTSSWEKHDQHLRLYHGTMVYAQSHLSRRQQTALGVTMFAVCALRLVVSAVLRRPAARSYRQLLSSAALVLRRQPLPLPRSELTRPRV